AIPTQAAEIVLCLCGSTAACVAPVEVEGERLIGRAVECAGDRGRTADGRRAGQDRVVLQVVRACVGIAGVVQCLAIRERAGGQIDSEAEAEGGVVDRV